LKGHYGGGLEVRCETLDGEAKLRSKETKYHSFDIRHFS
jgi:hypothetical protein